MGMAMKNVDRVVVVVVGVFEFVFVVSLAFSMFIKDGEEVAKISFSFAIDVFFSVIDSFFSVIDFFFLF